MFWGKLNLSIRNVIWHKNHWVYTYILVTRQHFSTQYTVHSALREVHTARRVVQSAPYAV